MGMATRPARWNLAEINKLPEDGNRYELVRGELLVTPPPPPAHESLADVLAERLHPYVRIQGLGRISRPRSVVQMRGSQVEPDLSVRPIPERVPAEWRAAPRPILVVEVLSDATRRHDLVQKRTFYVEEGIPDYWMVDGDQRVIRVAGASREDACVSDLLVWHPAGAAEPLIFDVQKYFREALGERLGG